MAYTLFFLFLGIQTPILCMYYAIVYSSNVDVPQANMLIIILMVFFVSRKQVT